MKLLAVIFSAFLIILADTLIKKVSFATEYILTLWISIGLLYSIQCYIAYLVFKTGEAELAVFACLFVIFYTIFGCIVGYFYFDEILSYRQIIGIVLALIGSILITS